MSEEIFDLIDTQLQGSRVIAYIKGSPYAPSCGFSARVSEILMKHQLDFSYVNVLEHPEIRQWLPEHSCWPTFPQIFIDEDLIGGCDILCEIDKSGELLKIIEEKKLPKNKKITNLMKEPI
jgi:monothiol glutaredoxin